MAFLTETFDVNELPVGKSGNFEPLPAGWYSATITHGEVKKTKIGGGEYIKLRFDITGPTHQGRVVFGNLNIKNASPKAEEIGRQQLGEIMRAIGLAKVADTDQLIGGQISIKLTIKDDAQYGPSNEIKGFNSLTGSVAPSSMSFAAPVSAPIKLDKAAPPWAKK